MFFAAIRGSGKAACSTASCSRSKTACGACSSGTAFQEMALCNGARRGGAEPQQSTGTAGPGRMVPEMTLLLQTLCDPACFSH